MTILKMRVDKVKGHKVYETWLVGTDFDHLRKVGSLVFEIGEYQIIGATLLIGAKTVNKDFTRLEIVNDETVFRQWAEREAK
ncbi:MAG: hypothetical protein KKD18_03045 [Nanoarchaeota archaeon]|nr:hypothetical protein [Nanoarchaeota archaeon]